jgi:hypothetical protein
LLVAVLHQDFVVDVFLAELVFDHGDAHAMLFLQDAVEQGGFAGAEEAGEDGGGNHCHENAYAGIRDAAAQAVECGRLCRNFAKACKWGPVRLIWIRPDGGQGVYLALARGCAWS